MRIPAMVQVVPPARVSSHAGSPYRSKSTRVEHLMAVAHCGQRPSRARPRSSCPQNAHRRSTSIRPSASILGTTCASGEPAMAYARIEWRHRPTQETTSTADQDARAARAGAASPSGVGPIWSRIVRCVQILHKNPSGSPAEREIIDRARTQCGKPWAEQPPRDRSSRNRATHPVAAMRRFSVHRGRRGAGCPPHPQTLLPG